MRIMSIPVRIPHATSSPTIIGDICHLGAEIEPIPEVAIFRPSEKLLCRPLAFGSGPYCG
jgi:hypothetical protein